MKAGDDTLRLINVSQQTLYFWDRPARVAGNLTMPAYLGEWKAGEGPFGTYQDRFLQSGKRFREILKL